MRELLAACAERTTATNGRILLVDDARLGRAHDRSSARRAPCRCREPIRRRRSSSGAEGDYDLVIVSLGFKDFDALRLCVQIRSLERTRHLPILLIAECEDERACCAGSISASTTISCARSTATSCVARRAHTDPPQALCRRLRDNVQATIELAVTDPLTGLHNRRYLEAHLATLLDQAAHRGRPLSLMILDIDHSRRSTTRMAMTPATRCCASFAARHPQDVRGIDLVCRLGGEEFVVVMPDTTLVVADTDRRAHPRRDRERRLSARRAAATIPVTVSIGLADRGRDANPDASSSAPTEALYASKASGRNRVDRRRGLSAGRAEFTTLL